MKQHTTNTPVKATFVTLIFLFSFIVSVHFLSCNKIQGGDTPLVPRGSLLTFTIWGLSSATSIDSLSTGTRVSYKGAAIDSLIFLWRLDPNVDFYGINSFIGGVNTQYAINRIGANNIVSDADTSTIAPADTIMLATLWKQGYSDTLFVTKTSPTQLVFNVRYTLPTGNGVEVDSFRSIGHY